MKKISMLLIFLLGVMVVGACAAPTKLTVSPKILYLTSPYSKPVKLVYTTTKPSKVCKWSAKVAGLAGDVTVFAIKVLVIPDAGGFDSNYTAILNVQAKGIGPTLPTETRKIIFTATDGSSVATNECTVVIKMNTVAETK